MRNTCEYIHIEIKNLLGNLTFRQKGVSEEKKLNI